MRAMTVFVRSAGKLAAGLLLVTLACSLSPRDRLNVLLVSFDTTRADRVGCYGYLLSTTPNIDRLAGQALRFERVYTPVPITLPAHTSLLTGAYPPAHGVRSNGMFRLGPGIETLAECFSRAGYATAAFMGSFVLDSRYGLARGFDLYDDDMITGGRRSGVLLQRELAAGEVTGRALAWLGKHRREPFFLFVHYLDPHRPWEAPPEFSSRFTDPYDAEIAYADSQLGRLLSALDSLHLSGETLVAVCADHGEGLGEHGEETHATFVYNTTVRVPLVIHVPGRDDLAGVTDEREVSLVDVAPTLAALCRVDAPAHSQGTVIVGPDKADRSLPRPPLYLECFYPFYSHGWSPVEAVVRRGMKYVRAPISELYDLEADPGEKNNLLAADSSAGREYAQVLANLKSRIAEMRPERAARVSAPGKEEEAGLRSLGYVSGRYREAPADISGLPDPKELIATSGAYMLGVTYMADGRLDLASSEFERILARDSSNWSVWEFLSETELQRERFDRAKLAAQQAMKAPEPTERAHFCLGMSWLMLGDTTAAQEQIDRTLQLDSVYGPALAIKARITESHGEPRAALGYYLRAERQMPDNPDLLTDFGSCLISLGDYGRAAEVLQRAVVYDDATWRANFNLGVALQLEGRFQPAVEAYRGAARLPEAPAEVWNNLGICLFSLKDYPSGDSAYRRAVELNPGYQEAWNNLAGCLAARGNIDEAVEAYARALALQPDYADALVNYGMLLAEIGNSPDSARSLIERGARLLPEGERRRQALAVAGRLRRQAGSN